MGGKRYHEKMLQVPQGEGTMFPLTSKGGEGGEKIARNGRKKRILV